MRRFFQQIPRGVLAVASLAATAPLAGAGTAAGAFTIPPAADANAPPAPAGNASAGLERFAAKLDQLVAQQRRAGLYPESVTLAFRLKGHGVVFVSRATRSPLGAPEAYLHLLRVPAFGQAPSPDLDRNAELRRLAEAGGLGRVTILRLTEARRLDRAEAELKLARQQFDDLAVRLREETSQLRQVPDGGAGKSAADTIARLGSTSMHLLSVARLEAETAGLNARVEEIAELLEGGGPGSAPASRRDRLTPLAQALVDLLLREGRTVAPGPGERVTIVVLLRPVGEEKPVGSLQVSVSGDDLPASQDPGELETARKKVAVTRSPS